DGAAAVVVMSDTRARELGIAPRARIVASSVSGVAPEIMGVGPIEAVRRVLNQAGMTIDDVDVVELNEAFAAQVLPVCRELGIDPFSDKLNPHGGAIALGHPYGMTGARIMNTLLNDLESDDKEIGRVSWAQYVFNCQAPDAGNGEILHLFGSDEQKERWLKPLVEGEARSFFSMTEPDVSGADPTGLQTTAVLEDGEWVINGH